jgi:zinc-finger of transposase IS204/IS1001/IS1096/IS1165
VTFRVRAKAGDPACPGCRRRSSRVHARYQRQLADLPLGARQVQIIVHIRRFKCANPRCGQSTFSEQIPGPPQTSDTPRRLTGHHVITARAELRDRRQRATAVLGNNRHTCWVVPFDREQGRADSLHPDGAPRPCQNKRKNAVASGRQLTPRTTLDLGKCRLTRCVKQPSKQQFNRAVDLDSQPQSRPIGQPTLHLWAESFVAGADEAGTGSARKAPGRCPLARLRGGCGRCDHRSGLLRKPSMRDGDLDQGPGVPCSYHRYRSAARSSGELGLTMRAGSRSELGERSPGGPRPPGDSRRPGNQVSNNRPGTGGRQRTLADGAPRSEVPMP